MSGESWGWKALATTEGSDINEVRRKKKEKKPRTLLLELTIASVRGC
jgi:hypothetical protein